MRRSASKPAPEYDRGAVIACDCAFSPAEYARKRELAGDDYAGRMLDGRRSHLHLCPHGLGTILLVEVKP